MGEEGGRGSLGEGKGGEGQFKRREGEGQFKGREGEGQFKGRGRGEMPSSKVGGGEGASRSKRSISCRSMLSIDKERLDS